MHTPSTPRPHLAALAMVALALLGSAAPPTAAAESLPPVTHMTPGPDSISAADVAGYQALMGLAPAPGLPGYQGVGTFAVNPTNSVISTQVQYSPYLNAPFTTKRIVCRIQTPTGPATIARDLPPPTSGTIVDDWPATPAVVNAFTQGTCYVVFFAANYPKGAIAGQILPVAPSGGRTCNRRRPPDHPLLTPAAAEGLPVPCRWPRPRHHLLRRRI